MGNFQLPRLYGLNASGATIPGALLYFYDAGTTTPITTYNDEANLSAQTNPLVADGDGRFPPVWVSTSQGAFKAELRDAENVLIWTEDDIKAYGVAGPTSVSGTSATFNPLDYGGIGDGSATDDTTAIQDTINAAETRNGGGTVDLGGLIWRVDSQLTIPGSDVSLVNGTLDFSQATVAADPCILGAATKEGAVALLSAATVGDQTITLVASGGTGMATGDLLQLTSGGDIFTSVEDGELVRVASVAGDVITLSTQLVGTYATGTVVRIDEASLLQNIVFRDLRIRLKAAAASSAGIQMDGCRNLRVENVTVYDGPPTGVGLEIRYTEQVSITDCHFRDIQDPALLVSRSSRDVAISNCGFQNCDTGLQLGAATGGQVHSVGVSSCHAAGGVVGILADTASSSVSIQGCTCEDNSAAGIRVFGAGVTVLGNNVNRTALQAIEVEHRRTVTYTTGGGYSPASAQDENGYVVSGNIIRLAGTYGIDYTNATASITHRGLSITDNVISGCGTNGVRCNILTNQEDITITNNRIRNTGSQGIVVDANTVQVTHLTITSNTIADTGGLAIDALADTAPNLTDVDISHNRLAPASGADALKVTNADDVVVNANRVSQSTAIAMHLDTCNYAAVTGNTVRGAGTVGIQLEDCSHSRAAGNRVDSPGSEGLYWLASTAGTYEDVMFSGNTVVGPAEAGISVNCQTGDLIGLSITDSHVDTPGTNRDCILLTIPASRSLTRAYISGGILRADTASAGEGVRIDGNATGTATDIMVSGVHIFDGGIQIDNADYVDVSRNQLDDSSGIGIYLIDCTYATVDNNRLKSPGGTAIRFEGTSNDLVCSNNTCHEFTGTGISFLATATETITGAVCVGNNVSSDGSGSNVIFFNSTDADGIQYVTCNGNVARGGLSCIKTINCNHVTCNGNTVENSNSESLYFDDTTNLTCVGNTVDNPGSGDAVLWRADSRNVGAAAITGNNIENGRVQVRVNTSRTVENFVITGNSFSDFADRSILLFANGASANILQFFTISGNHIRGGGTFAGIKLNASAANSTIRTGLIGSNHISATTSGGRGIWLTGPASSTLDDIALLGNSIKMGSGSTCIELDASGTATDLVAAGNVVGGNGTAITETAGTFDFGATTTTEADLPNASTI